MSAEPKIYLDLDRTLFDTDSFYKALIGAFSGAGVTERLFKKTHSRSKVEGIYKPEGQLELLERKGFDRERLAKKLEEIMAQAGAFIYDDTVGFLEDWHGRSELALVTFGDKKFQRRKVDGAGLSRFFDKLEIVTKRDKSSVFPLSGKQNLYYYVDDDIFSLKRVKKKRPYVTVVRMKRKGSKYASRPTPAGIDHAVKNLSQLKDILKCSIPGIEH